MVLEARPTGIAEVSADAYYAVVFTSLRTGGGDGYDETSARMVELASRQPGFLGVESARGPDGLGITVSYWESREAISGWKRNAEHVAVQDEGRRRWYRDYRIRVLRLEYEYGMPSTGTLEEST